MSTPNRISLAALVCAGLASVASAQPKLVITGLVNDMSATGNAAVGLVYDADAQEYVPFTWTRDGGYTQIPGAFAFGGGTGLFCSTDLSTLAMTSDNISNWAELNCFRGYNTTTGELLPPYSEPCPVVGTPHRWTASAGWVNTGSFERFPDPVTGRMIGGTRCDAFCSSVGAMSDNGRYVLANGYYATAFRPNGSISSGLCGSYYPYVYDSINGSITQLPVQPGTVTARGDRINADGTVITGYDLDSTQSRRRTSVWRNGVQTILDNSLGAKENAGVNAAGTVLASGASSGFVAANFSGETGVRLVRWIWDGATWLPENLGVPEAPEELALPFTDLWVTGISADGNTIVGSVQWGPPPPAQGGVRRPFIWRPTINDGQPIDLELYLSTIDDPQNPIFGDGFTITYASSVSDDGNAILLTMWDARNTCIEPARSHVTGPGGILYLDGSQVPCDPPQIGLSPKDWNEASDYSFGSALNVLASGSWPLSYQWQREDPNSPGSWINLEDSCSNFDDSNWDYEGTHTVQIRIGQHYGGGGRSGNYRVIVSNPCGSVVSDPATLTHIVGACCIPGNACYVEYQSRCSVAGGVWLGVGSTCDVDPCEFAPCCQSDGTCTEMIPSLCSAAGGTPGNVGESCFSHPCPAFCDADWCKDGSVGVPDIFCFLSDWFAFVPAARSYGGTPGVPAIFAFLSTWFATGQGPCTP